MCGLNGFLFDFFLNFLTMQATVVSPEGRDGRSRAQLGPGVHLGELQKRGRGRAGGRSFCRAELDLCLGARHGRVSSTLRAEAT